MTLHTGGPCTFNAPANEESGVSNNDNYDCNLNSAIGCSVQGPVGSYGSSLNAHGGGVYAMEWTSSFIKIFFFPRNAIPADITAGKPNPSSWGLPAAAFDSQNGNCDIDANFPPQTIVSINTLLPLSDRCKRDLKWRTLTLFIVLRYNVLRCRSWRRFLDQMDGLRKQDWLFNLRRLRIKCPKCL